MDRDNELRNLLAIGEEFSGLDRHVAAVLHDRARMLDDVRRLQRRGGVLHAGSVRADPGTLQLRLRRKRDVRTGGWDLPLHHRGLFLLMREMLLSRLGKTNKPFMGGMPYGSRGH